MTAAVDTARTDAAKRLDAFVDAAFAFAVSLLVIAGNEPPTDLKGLITALAHIPAFAGCFCLIAMFWLAHRDYGRLTPERDVLATVLSLAIVFTVLVYVFPLRQLILAALFWISGGRLPGANLISSFGDLRTLYAIYGLGFMVLAGLFAALFAHATARAEHLGMRPEAREDTREHTEIWLIAAAAGLVSALLALFGPLRQAPWLPGMTYSLIPAIIGIRAAILKARKRRAAP